VDEKHITHHSEIPGGNKQGSIDAIGFFIQQNLNLRGPSDGPLRRVIWWRCTSPTVKPERSRNGHC
jgi:hypothetical protein